MPDAADHAFMAQALRLARRGLNTTTPNPRVGCVLVRGGAVVGEGWHERAGGPHAEVLALAAAGERARGATAYVTLEPCHHHGRTPPCDAALAAAGVARVVAAMTDPDPRTAGQGLALLAAAGIAVESGVMEAQARELNIGFVSRLTRGRPWVRLKIAASLDGRTAPAQGAAPGRGGQPWITSEAARRDGHRLRARACAILTGMGTVRTDDPQLTVRGVETPRQPLRVVADAGLTISAAARVLQGGALVVCAGMNESAAAPLRAAGVEVEAVGGVEGRVDLAAAMALLAARGINELHVEAGATLNGALLAAGLVDEIVLYMAPAVLGGDGPGLFAGAPPAAAGFGIVDLRRVGDDLRLTFRRAA